MIYPRLHALGWRDDTYLPKRSAFDALLPIGAARVPLLVLGTSELDAKSIERMAKLEGGQTLKINPRMKALLRATNDLAFVNRYMKEFYDLGWRGRPRNGKNLTWGVVQVSAEEINSCEAAMIYHPRPDCRDHTGRSGDFDNLNAFFDVFERMLKEAGSLHPI